MNINKTNLEIMTIEKINNVFQVAKAIGDDNRVLGVLKNCLFCEKYVPLHWFNFDPMCSKRRENITSSH